jgi:hypothetical protein
MIIYEKQFSNHTIQFWPVCTMRTLWTASDNFLLIDGRLAAQSGGICFRSKARASLPGGDQFTTVEMRTKTSRRGPIHLDYELLIDDKVVDSGSMRMSFMWRKPRDIEQHAR